MDGESTTQERNASPVSQRSPVAKEELAKIREFREYREQVAKQEQESLMTHFPAWAAEKARRKA